jgi:hypothetical protein
MKSIPGTTTTRTPVNREGASCETKEVNDAHQHQSEEEFRADLAKALAESMKSSQSLHRTTEFIVLDASDDSEDEDDSDRKIPAKINGDAAVARSLFNDVVPSASIGPSAMEKDDCDLLRGAILFDASDSDNDGDRKMPAKTNGDAVVTKYTLNVGKDSGPSAMEGDDCHQLKEAIRQSLEEAKSAANRPLLHVDADIPHNICRKLTRQDLQNAVDEFVYQQGGYDRIESGQMVKHGNTNDMKKSCVADGGGQHQTGAQYGRYSILGMWRVFDVLEGKADILLDSTVDEGKSERKRRSHQGGGGGNNNRLIGLPGAKITAFVDIGHGIGIQVLQAGWSIGVPSRGVEIMKDRHLIAISIKDGVIESLRGDPPDSTGVELRLADFSHAMVPDRETCQRDTKLHSYLLCKDKSKEIQEGLVVFINNAEDVFAARSNQNAKGICLDALLAKMFAQMQIGGRMVTLTDISCHLTQSTEWFRHDVFDSGPDAVSWGYGHKSVHVHILTKLSNTWYCQNKKCDYMKYATITSTCQDDFSAAAPNDVVNEFGELNEECVYCQAPARRCSRFRKPSHKRKFINT